MKKLIITGLMAFISLSLNAQISKHNGHPLKGANTFTADLTTHIFYCSKCKKYIDRYGEYNAHPNPFANLNTYKATKNDSLLLSGANTSLTMGASSLELSALIINGTSPNYVLWKFMVNGDVFYKGNKLTTDKQIVDGLKSMFGEYSKDKLILINKIDSLETVINKLRNN